MYIYIYTYIQGRSSSGRRARRAARSARPRRTHLAAGAWPAAWHRSYIHIVANTRYWERYLVFAQRATYRTWSVLVLSYITDLPNSPSLPNWQHALARYSQVPSQDLLRVCVAPGPLF